jgi:NitT/TauT family transport system substrate-binding protein
MKVSKLIIVIYGFSFFSLLIPASAAQQPSQLRLGYSSISGQRGPLWIALDEKIFEKYGLQVELLYIRSSTQALPALLGGSTQIIAGSAAGALHATANGARLKIVGSFGPTPYFLFTSPKIKDPGQLKGSIIGVNRIGSSDYYAVRRMLAKLSLSEKDVKIIQAGATSDRFIALQNGSIQATLGSETTFGTSKVRANRLVDIIKLGVEDHGSALIVTENFARRQNDLLVRFAQAFVEGIAIGKRRPEIAKKIYAKYLRTNNMPLIDQAYQSYMLGTVGRVPIFPAQVLRELMDDLAEAEPKIRELELADVLDNSAIQDLSNSGFINNLHK